MFDKAKGADITEPAEPGAVSVCLNVFNRLYLKEYIPLSAGIYMYGDSGYLLYHPAETVDFTNYQKFMEKYNSIIEVTSDVDFFAYYIPTAGAVDFTRLPIMMIITTIFTVIRMLSKWIV